MASGGLRQAAPLKDRVIHGLQESSTDSTDSSDAAHGKGSYKCWSEAAMSKAIGAVSQENMSVRRASELYNIPRSTLADRITGRVQPGAKSGPPKILTDEEEEELVSFLCRLSDIGYPKTRKQVVDLVNQIAITRGRTEISMSWWDSFRRRYSHLSLRSASTLSVARANASDPQCIEHYFDILEETLRENGLMDTPASIYNMDETGMPLDPKALKTIHPRGKKDAHCTSSGNKVQITVVGCVSASGQSLPPMIIWDRKTLNPGLAEREIPGTLYGLSSKGWMDGVLFEQWFSRHFLRYIPSSRPVLLLLDGHSSHFSPRAVELAAKEKIILFTLPPNTTHLTQPLDKGIFGPLKFAWRRLCHDFLARNPGRVITRYDFSPLFSEAWIESMTPKNILAGFRVTGVHPLNRHAFDADHKKPSLTEKTGLRYIPLFTPSKSMVENESDVPASINISKEQIDGDQYHPCSRQRPLNRALTVPSPVHPKSRGPRVDTRVLTSEENLRVIREKEKEKARKIKQKEERAQQRLVKKAMKDTKKKVGQDSNIIFTSEEISKFERRYENGFDILSDKRYNAWLKVHGLTGAKKLTESAEPNMQLLSSSSPSSPLRSSTPSDSSSTTSALLKKLNLSLSSSNSMESDAKCGAKPCIIQACSLYKVKWIFCDGCSTWFHKYCVGLEESDDPSEYCCEACENSRKSHGIGINQRKLRSGKLLTVQKSKSNTEHTKCQNSSKIPRPVTRATKLKSASSGSTQTSKVLSAATETVNRAEVSAARGVSSGECKCYDTHSKTKTESQASRCKSKNCIVKNNVVQSAGITKEGPSIRRSSRKAPTGTRQSTND